MPWQPIPGAQGVELKSRVVPPTVETPTAEAVPEDREFVTRRFGKGTMRLMGTQ